MIARRPSFFAVLALCCGCLLLSACSRARHCDSTHPYHRSSDGQQLTAPDGLIVPPAEQGLVIPEVTPEARAAAKSEDCIVMPPSLQDDAS